MNNDFEEFRPTESKAHDKYLQANLASVATECYSADAPPISSGRPHGQPNSLPSLELIERDRLTVSGPHALTREMTRLLYNSAHVGEVAPITPMRELAEKITEAVGNEVAFETACQKLDKAVDASDLSEFEKQYVKKLEHALLRGDPTEISKCLKELSELSKSGHAEEVESIQSRVEGDFRKLGTELSIENGRLTISDSKHDSFQTTYSIDETGHRHQSTTYKIHPLLPLEQDLQDKQVEQRINSLGKDAMKKLNQDDRCSDPRIDFPIKGTRIRRPLDIERTPVVEPKR